MSVKEALLHAGLAHNRDIEVVWVGAEDVEKEGAEHFLHSVQGVVVPGGFGERGIEGMIQTVNYARRNNLPYLGLCLGLQVMVIEIARNLLGKSQANSTEFNPDTVDPVIDLMPDQRDVTQKGGTMRLGTYPCRIVPDSWAANAYGKELINERHRHRFEFSNQYRKDFESVGLCATGLSPDGRLVEIMEMTDQRFMVGVQFHPEFLSRPDRPHPLFKDFVGVALDTLREGGQHLLPLESSSSHAL